jgi:hypothetical protein
MQKSSLPESLVPLEFSNRFGGLIKAVLAGFDRLRLCGCRRSNQNQPAAVASPGIPYSIRWQGFERDAFGGPPHDEFDLI